MPELPAVADAFPEMGRAGFVAQFDEAFGLHLDVFHDLLEVSLRNFAVAALPALSERASITMSSSPRACAESSITVPAARSNSPRWVVPRLRISNETSVRVGSSVNSVARELACQQRAERARRLTSQL